MDYSNDALTIHTAEARTVAANGGTLPNRWLEIDQNYENYTYRQSNFLHDLSQAVINGEPEDRLNELHARTLADAVGSTVSHSGTAEALINEQVRRKVAAALIVEYAKVAGENLKAVAAQFNLKSQQLRALAEQVDVEATAESLISAPDEARMAWLKAAEVAAELDKTLVGLAAAANLAGARISGKDALIGLVCPTDGVGKARRAVWAAWDTDGRTGRYGALLAAGIEVKAIDSVQKYRTYGRPQMVNKVEHDGWGIRQTWVDAEDGSPVE
ncbi:hypothetical protein [Nocardia sp. NBC_00403]|uniref:hypothetical protein n=1 Tax=Nocardia sp. NBC_00403 TaxID=2975990 RepID=UPI002E1D08D4